MVALQEEISCANLCKTDSGLSFHALVTVVSKRLWLEPGFSSIKVLIVQVVFLGSTAVWALLVLLNSPLLLEDCRSVHWSLVSFAGLLSAFLYTAVQIHAKLIMALNRIRPKCSFPVQVGRGSNAQSSCGIALVPACGGRRELLCIKVSCELTCKFIQGVCICYLNIRLLGTILQTCLMWFAL